MWLTGPRGSSSSSSPYVVTHCCLFRHTWCHKTKKEMGCGWLNSKLMDITTVTYIDQGFQFPKHFSEAETVPAAACWMEVKPGWFTDTRCVGPTAAEVLLLIFLCWNNSWTFFFLQWVNLFSTRAWPLLSLFTAATGWLDFNERLLLVVGSSIFYYLMSVIPH